MSRVISGTRAKRGMQAVGRTAHGRPNAIRCGCGRTAVPVPDGKGGTKLKCPGCKNEYIAKPIDG